MSQVIELILDKLVENLTLYCITDEADAQIQAGVVMKGRYQGDPTEDRIVIQILENDPTKDREWRHEAQRNRQTLRGKTPWLRRFTVKITCNFTTSGEDKATASEYSHRVLQNVENCIDRKRVNVGPDDKGEQVVNSTIALVDSLMWEGGGNENELLWTGLVYCQFLTETN